MPPKATSADPLLTSCPGFFDGIRFSWVPLYSIYQPTYSAVFSRLTLLNNSYLDTNSIIFLDEPEAALLPTTISRLLEMIAILSTQGIQFFLATHSSGVFKKLHLLCQTLSMSIPIIANEGDTWAQHDLLDGISTNSSPMSLFVSPKKRSIWRSHDPHRW